MDGRESDAKKVSAPYVVAVIPCKTLSDRLPFKNFQDVGGKPMMLWAVMRAMCCPDIDLVAISTENSDEVMKRVPQLSSSIFDRVILMDRVEARHPNDPLFAVVIDALHQLGIKGVMERDPTHLVLLQPNVPTLDQGVVNRLVAAVVHDNFNVARHFDPSGAMTGGCDAYKIGALQSPIVMDSYNYAVVTNDIEVHTAEDLEVVRQVVKMRPVEGDARA